MGWEVGGGAWVVIGVRKIVKNGCLSRTMFEGGRRNKPRNFQTLLHPPTHPACRPQRGLPLASALAIARTKAKDWLATASASRLDPTPTVTVGHICAPSGFPQRPLCACC